MPRIMVSMSLFGAFLHCCPAARGGPDLDEGMFIPESAATLDLVGASLDITGDAAIISAHGNNALGRDAGVAFLLDLGSDRQAATLFAPDAAPNDQFASSVAIDGPIAIVGVRHADDRGRSSGAAYVFDVARPESPELVAKLTPRRTTSGDQFGTSVAMAGGIALVGAWGGDARGSRAGAAYLFDLSNPSIPVERAMMLPDDGKAGDLFGAALDISGPTAIVGASGADGNGAESGAAYLFDLSDPNRPEQVARITPPDGAAADRFGSSVAIDGNLAIIGAWGHDAAGQESGAAYLYKVSDPSNPALLARILPDHALPGQLFGFAVAIDDHTLVVAAPHSTDHPVRSGTVHLLDISNPNRPSFVAPGLTSGSATQDRFGAAVDISGGTIIAGAPHNAEHGDRAGAALIFNTACLQSADLTGGSSPGEPDGRVDHQDLLYFIELFQQHDPRADISSPDQPGVPDGVVNAYDFFHFLTLYAEGCV